MKVPTDTRRTMRPPHICSYGTYTCHANGFVMGTSESTLFFQCNQYALPSDMYVLQYNQG